MKKTDSNRSKRSSRRRSDLLHNTAQRRDQRSSPEPEARSELGKTVSLGVWALASVFVIIMLVGNALDQDPVRPAAASMTVWDPQNFDGTMQVLKEAEKTTKAVADVVSETADVAKIMGRGGDLTSFGTLLGFGNQIGSIGSSMEGMCFSAQSALNDIRSLADFEMTVPAFPGVSDGCGALGWVEDTFYRYSGDHDPQVETDILLQRRAAQFESATISGLSAGKGIQELMATEMDTIESLLRQAQLESDGTGSDSLNKQILMTTVAVLKVAELTAVTNDMLAKLIELESSNAMANSSFLVGGIAAVPDEQEDDGDRSRNEGGFRWAPPE